MHTVPESYFEAFDVREHGRGKPAVWRFDRITGESRLLGVRDAEIAKTFTQSSVMMALRTLVSKTAFSVDWKASFVPPGICFSKENL
jgi:hypothetical protein